VKAAPPSRLTTQAGLLAASRAAGQVLNALVGFVAVRQLTQDDFGSFRQIYLLFTTFLLVADLGFSESLYYFIPRGGQRIRSLMLRSVAVVGMAQAVVAAALVVFRARLAAWFSNPGLADLFALLALFLAFSALTRLWEVQLIAEQRASAAAAVIGGFEGLKVGLMLAVLLLAPQIHLLLWAMVAATGVKMAAFAWFLARPRGWTTEAQGTTTEGQRFGKQWAYALALWIPGSLNILAMQAHQFIIGFSFSPAEFALYSVACFQIPLLGVLGTSVGEVLLVRATQYRAAGRKDQTYRVWQNACRKSFLIYLPVSVALAALAEPLMVALFTAKYSASAPLFAILAAALPFQVTFHDAVLRACGAMRAYGLFYILRLALSIVLGVAGAQWLGLAGVAVSSVAALLLVNLAQHLYVTRLLGVGLGQGMPWQDLGRMAVFSAVAAAAALAVSVPLSAWPWLALAAGLTAFGLVFAGLAWKSSLLRAEERDAVASRLGRLLGKTGPSRPGAEKETYA